MSELLLSFSFLYTENSNLPIHTQTRRSYILYRDAISTPERPVLIAPVGLAFEAVYDAVMIEEGITNPSLGNNQFTK